MAYTPSSLMILCLLLSSLTITSSLLTTSSGSHDTTRVPTAPRGCQGSVGECMGIKEFDVDSEINRRILTNVEYIGYGALQRDTVPCSIRSASYYNCLPDAEANPYDRGCDTITRCRS